MPPSVPPPSPSPGRRPTDGRSTRWESHRADRRAELIDAAVAAIDTHGPDANVAQIAAIAGVSKPVLYRYFQDKSELHTAVAHWAADQVIAGIAPALLAPGGLRPRIEAAVDSYLTLITEHPQVFRLLVQHRGATTDLLNAGTSLISAAISRLIGDGLRALGLDAGGAEPWATGLVGLGVATGEWWLDRDTMSRSAVRGYLSDFIWHAFSGMAAERGVDLDDLTRLVAVRTTTLEAER